MDSAYNPQNPLFWLRFALRLLRYTGLNDEAEPKQGRGDTIMQQALYNHISISNPSAAGTAQRGTALVRWVAHRWELAGVLALMGSSAAYGVFALTHLGL